jgi:hypothetical protein
MARDDGLWLSRGRIQAAGSPHRSLPGLATRERRTGRPEVLVAALLAVLAGAGATWYGFLAHTHGHPAVRLAGALALTSGGLAAVLLATPLPRPEVHVPGARGPSSPAAHAAATGTVAAILGLLSMAVALIHFAVIEQHWAVYWLYGLFFIGTAPAQLGWALAAVPAAPARWLLCAGALGNALMVITWIVTRTVGVLIGPAATMPDRAGFGDLAATIMEVLIVTGCLVLLSWRPQTGAGRAWQARMIAALIVVPFLVLALYSAVGGSPFVSMVG